MIIKIVKFVKHMVSLKSNYIFCTIAAKTIFMRNLSIFLVLILSLSIIFPQSTRNTYAENMLKISNTAAPVLKVQNSDFETLQTNSETENSKIETADARSSAPMLAIVIDDFGGYDQSGVEAMLAIDAPLTCAVMPNLENSTANSEAASKAGKEVILHMPMQAHVRLPESWYGPSYICSGDSKSQVYDKINNALTTVPDAKGFNIHIGSGVCQNSETMGYIYDFAIDKNLPFLDSRTHMNTIAQAVANQKNTIYLGRDEFLEPNGNRSFESVKHHIMVGASLAKERGYAIIIGHVGAHGGKNTAKAIASSLKEIKDIGIEIVTLSKLYENLNSTFVNLEK